MTVIEKTKKVLITSILALVIIAVLAGGAYWYHVRSLNELREEMISQAWQSYEAKPEYKKFNKHDMIESMLSTSVENVQK